MPGATTRVAPTATPPADSSASTARHHFHHHDTRCPLPTPKTAPSLGSIVGAFKSRATVEYILGVKTHAWPAFHGRLWQRNYYEHVIRNDESLDRIRQYIHDNPARWAHDPDNPHTTAPDPFDEWAR
jgi:hypothetical protein